MARRRVDQRASSIVASRQGGAFVGARMRLEADGQAEAGKKGEVLRRLVEKYEKLLDGDSGPNALGVLEAEERRDFLKQQGINPNTLEAKAAEAIERTRLRSVLYPCIHHTRASFTDKYIVHKSQERILRPICTLAPILPVICHLLIVSAFRAQVRRLVSFRRALKGRCRC